jgi:hypothetical protein
MRWRISSLIAAYLDDLVTGNGYWDGESILMPMNLCVAALSLIQHLTEELDPSPMPEVLIAPTIRLNNEIGRVLAEQHPR